MEAVQRQVLKIIIFMLFAKHSASNSCWVDYSDPGWLDDWSLFLTQNGNDEYELFRHYRVAANENIIAVCNSNYKPVVVKCNENRQFSRAVPFKSKCDQNKRIAPVRLAEKVSYCPYTLYKIGFNVDIDSATKFVEAYQVCFDHKHMRPLFSISKTYAKGVPFRNDLNFEPDNIFYGKFYAAFSRASSFERFKKLLGPNQKYMIATNPDHIINRGHLTPSADFALINQKRSTYSMINAIPQFRTINNGNWRRIEDWTRGHSHTPLRVCTGVLDCNLDSKNIADLECVVKLQNARGKWVPIFLADDLKIPVPSWSYKIMKNNQLSVVFLTFNNIYYKGNIQVPKHVCKEIDCPLELTKTIKDGRTFCCQYNDFINRNVPHLKEVC